MHIYWHWSRKGLEHRATAAADAPYCPDNRKKTTAQRTSRNETQTISTPNQTNSIENIQIFGVESPKIFARLSKQSQELYKYACLSQNHSEDKLKTRSKISSAFNADTSGFHSYGTGIATE